MMVGAAAARLQLALAVIFGGTGAFLILSMLTTTTSAPSVAVLAVVAATIAAVVGPNRLPVTPVSSPLMLSPGRGTSVGEEEM